MLVADIDVEYMGVSTEPQGTRFLRCLGRLDCPSLVFRMKLWLVMILAIKDGPEEFENGQGPNVIKCLMLLLGPPKLHIPCAVSQSSLLYRL